MERNAAAVPHLFEKTTMKVIAMPFLTIPLALALAAPPAREPVRQQAPSPHQWLQELAGDWRVGGEAVSADSGGEAVEPQVTESVRPIGTYWIVSEGTIPTGFGSITYLRTLGYDPGKESFVGTWVDSTSTHLWVYSGGSLDAAGKTLTLESEGPGFDGGMARYREVIELDGPDRRVHENFVQGEDGTWTSFEKSVYVRNAE